ncbi:hypothetical protein TVAG_406860 [Trichomonas vaginalis G3]|uniref:Uncharacterized protein n=1 Tax=Trichomonas vaginalis (strain ATCC PRA-98 / G3) TaxID=412133 RepID=A2FID6_TRIV3|nr:hypothetical protein TVAGG3_0200330 [Trichomonas vaginalis G3]EAX95338.1 hypothetical protein TVAG_406860 [Trichomonas vaginalis G3]KAI5550563.1 hypothetical protein TVAGG3_0200330 [Trichomonas vaginalis G3]|eukprot:XP_001308268.1 hypothetical protein [Trichomonas vaginalis G3]
MNKEREQRELIKQKLQEQSNIVEPMMKFLRKFSKHLRRDFLAILVKMASKEFAIPTVRRDWRTRKGMIAFLVDNWSNIKHLIMTDTFFKWYCWQFPMLEDLLVNRNFVMFLYDNWAKYKQILTNSNTNFLLTMNMPNLLQLISNASSSVDTFPSNWCQLEIGIGLRNLFGHFLRVSKSQAAPEIQHSLSVPNIVNSITDCSANEQMSIGSSNLEMNSEFSAPTSDPMEVSVAPDPTYTYSNDNLDDFDDFLLNQGEIPSPSNDVDQMEFAEYII